MFFKHEDKKVINKEDMPEKCVICGSDTPYKFKDNINDRLFYIEGSGQLCEKCFNKLY